MQKMNVRSILIYPVIWLIWKKVDFLGAQNTPFGRLQCPKLIWGVWAPRRPSLFLVYCASFMSRLPLLRMGGEVCIYLVGKQPVIKRCLNIFLFLKKFQSCLKIVEATCIWQLIGISVASLTRNDCTCSLGNTWEFGQWYYTSLTTFLVLMYILYIYV